MRPISIPAGIICAEGLMFKHAITSRFRFAEFRATLTSCTHIILADPTGRRASTGPSWNSASRLPCFRAASRPDVHLKRKRPLVRYSLPPVALHGSRRNAGEVCDARSRDTVKGWEILSFLLAAVARTIIRFSIYSSGRRAANLHIVSSRM